MPQSTTNFTPPSGLYDTKLKRKATLQDISKQKLKTMPGWRFSWYYSGVNEKPVESFDNYHINRAFVRNDCYILFYCLYLK